MSHQRFIVNTIYCDHQDCTDEGEKVASVAQVRTWLRSIGWRCDRRSGDHCPRHRGAIDRAEMAP